MLAGLQSDIECLHAKIDDLHHQICSLREENETLETQMNNLMKSREKLSVELEKNKEKMAAISEMEKKIEKYEFVLNIDKYRKVDWIIPTQYSAFEISTFSGKNKFRRRIFRYGSIYNNVF